VDTLRILLAESEDLKVLADLSGLDPFSFYEGADLRNADLGGQDLRGLSFFEADLRGANLGGVRYDKGAFNGSILSDKHKGFQDQFDGRLSDALLEPLRRVYMFARFRPETLNEIIEFLSISIQKFSESANISTTTLRKAKKGYVISFETAVGISEAINKISDQLNLKSVEFSGKIQIPMIEFLSDKVTGGFNRISREELLNINALSVRITESRAARGSTNIGENLLWRDRPRMLQWYDRIYNDRPHSRIRVTSPEEINSPVLPDLFDSGADD
jgi:predicted transcriptional regulator